jgi:NAD(P)-dependent dehydrogenase (short-subunit alcohol dehydrogenase family)
MLMVELTPRPVAVVIGVGGMGRAIARRLGSGKKLVLADFDEQTLAAAAADLRGDGYDVEARRVDVSDAASVRELAARAAALGNVVQIAHTAGLSPVQAPVEAIIAVDLVGVAHVVDLFAEVIAPGGSAVVISSMGGHMTPLAPEHERILAAADTAQLATLEFVQPGAIDPVSAYGLAKRANQVRMHAAAAVWGARGARINTISPGIISTPMAMQELAGDSGDRMRGMIEHSPVHRIGTVDDIAAAAAFLLGADASFITGTDLLVDGGVVAGVRSAGV